MSELIAANGSKPLLVPVSLRLAGELDAPGAGVASVTVIVGEQQFPAVMNGVAFEANLSGVNPDSMVRLEAVRGTSRYRALLGSALLLKRQAGSDRRLDIAESPSLRISPMSTAAHFFMLRGLGDRMPMSDAEIDESLQTLLPEDLAVAANAIRAVAAGEVVLPGTHASFDALLQDRNAYRIFLNRNPSIRTSADANVRSMPLGPFSPADLQRDWVLATTQGRPGMAYTHSPVQLMLRRLGGYWVHSNEARSRPEFDARLTAQGDMETVPLGQPYVDHWVYSYSPSTYDASRYVSRSTILRETYRRVFAGAYRQLWIRVRDQRNWIPPLPGEDRGNETVLSFWLASDLSGAAKPAVDSHVLGRRALPYFCKQASGVQGEPDRLAMCEYALHQLGSNGVGVVEGLGRKVNDALVAIASSGTAGLQWSIDGSGSFSTTDGVIDVKYWRLGVSDEVGDMMIYLASTGSGDAMQTIAGRVVVLNGNGPVYFSSTDPVGSWIYGSFDVRGPYAYDEYSMGYAQADRFDRATDGTQVQTAQYWIYNAPDAPPDSIFRYRSGWMLSNGGFFDTRYRANVSTGETGLQHYFSCGQALQRGATQCGPARVRYFKPIAKVGSRWYGIEEVYNTAITDYVAPILHDRSSRPNYYEKLSP
ncbi:MAG: hypothetical protein KF800_15645 [Lysobacter sp.]|nr:hypothetical protein [Lysobacter sp.]